MTSRSLTVVLAILGIEIALGAGCIHRHAVLPSRRTIISTYRLWDGMGPPNTDPQFARFECIGTLTISNLDVSFEPGDSPTCSSPMHQRTKGSIPYDQLGEIRVTKRPELLVFKKGQVPPALRVTDWKGAEQFQHVVADLKGTFEAWKLRRSPAPRQLASELESKAHR